MKVLVVGSGGREHALVSALGASPSVSEVFCAPGNAGIGQEATLLDARAESAEGIDALIREVRERSIDLTVVGPEAPLVAGIADRFEASGLRVFGCTEGAARLEGSKSFTKEFLARHDIPTAPFTICDSADAAYQAIERSATPVVVKADGLAAGKGVVVAASREEACRAVDAMMVEKRFGAAGERVVIEECLRGSEISLFVVSDGTDYVLLETAQDYKPIFDGDRGPNTGGMGTYSPYVAVDDPVVEQARSAILEPTLEGMRAEGHPYRGVLYAGLMLTETGPQVIEYNVRFGDPEAQSLLFRFRGDFAEMLERATGGELRDYRPRWDPRHAVCVIAASGGYPGSYEKGKAIRGLEDIRSPDVKIYHAGTALDPRSGEIVTSGGRVLGVTALGETRDLARQSAYGALENIRFEGMQFRKDIGLEGR